MISSNFSEIYLGIVQNKNKEVLIVHRIKEEQGSGQVVLSWVFPGGGANSQTETKEEAVVREVFEETGYSVKPIAIISKRKHPDFPVYIYYFECQLESEMPIQIPNDPEVENAYWVKPIELKNYFTSDLDSKVNKYLNLKN